MGRIGPDPLWQRLLARYPLGSRLALAWQGLIALTSNGVIVWLVGSGRMTPFELVVLVVLEAVLLIGIAMAHARLVPAAAREQNPMPMRQRLGTFAFALVWLGGAYGIVLFAMLRAGPEVQRLIDDPLAFVWASNLRWPLAITLACALVDALQDAMHFRRHGGTFISTPGFNGAARWLTLFLGGIPFFIPFVAFAFAVKTLAEAIAARYRPTLKTHDRSTTVMLVVVPLLMLTSFGSIAWMLDSGVSLWAVGYCSAKFVAELFIVCLPLIATRAHREETQAANAPPAAARKRKAKS